MFGIFVFYTQSTHKGAPILSVLYQWGKSFKIRMQSEYQSLFEHAPETFKTHRTKIIIIVKMEIILA